MAEELLTSQHDEEAEEEIDPDLKERLLDGAIVITSQYRLWRDACREGEVSGGRGLEYQKPLTSSFSVVHRRIGSPVVSHGTCRRDASNCA